MRNLGERFGAILKILLFFKSNSRFWVKVWVMTRNDLKVVYTQHIVKAQFQQNKITCMYELYIHSYSILYTYRIQGSYMTGCTTNPGRVWFKSGSLKTLLDAWMMTYNPCSAGVHYRFSESISISIYINSREELCQNRTWAERTKSLLK